ncbi:MAG: response regulator [Deltaproteobacteria bacterium]|nr:response regulator [Deltaproteobacteria bacterium]MBW1910035.1 response regulator [Deltaproteobacteria bacterium]MBW2034616.1 response regulator [Deltaproteobacteria bacterium]MBW2116107.1 response regulator [Deltaproteobacteria bacterium]
MRKKYGVLVVDDDASTRKLFEKILKAIPELEVELAKNGKEALTLIEKSLPDIILCDLMMPGMDGLELCRHLKSDADSDLSDIYLIMISTREAKEDKIKCMREGADDYLTKPVDPDELLARVKVGQRISSQLKKPQLEARRMFE